jgi:hypothetical protein
VDDLSFTFLGEVVQGHVTMVVMPNNAFDVATTWVHSLDYIMNNLGELSVNIPLFLPVDPNEHDVAVQVSSCKVIYLPKAFVPLFLNSGGYTVQQAWERLLPAIQRRQELQICQPLLAWLQVASMGTELPDNKMGNAVNAITICAPPADGKVLSHHLNILHQALPGLIAPPPALETVLSHMATTLVAQTNNAKAVREQCEAAEAEPKLPFKKKCCYFACPIRLSTH